MIKNLLGNIHTRKELIVLALMVMVVVMLIIPLPTYVIDMLIGLNLTVGMLIFMGSFYITRVLEYSTFPSILLITTIFRLAISISTSRLVLADADAGEIIASFGQFVIADNLVVGFVIFFIVTIVQFIVITKGSERIAEVSARFSLDAMPGKQMSIDGDLKAGVIDEDELKKRRSELEAESQLYGALDGAMKFIKGDAIAGIIIIFVNLLGGITVGVLQHGMPISEALHVYTMLTIGDALVAQIPALLISISGGLIVTRVNDNDSKNLGDKILRDMFSNDFILLITAILCIAIGFLPGFPLVVFIILSSLFMIIFIRRKILNKNKSSAESKEDNKDSEQSTEKPSKPVYIDGEFIPETIPIIIMTNNANQSFMEDNNVLTIIKRNFFVEYGIRIPKIIVSYKDFMQANVFSMSINEIHVANYSIVPDMHKVLLRGDELKEIDSSVFEVNINNVLSFWLPDSRVTQANKMGYYTRDAVDEFYTCISQSLISNINEFFGIQESKTLLDDLEKKYPELLKECYRNNTVQRITEVFQRLLQERISIRNMRLILEALVQWAPKEKDPIILVEHVRGVLQRYISNRFSHQGRLRAFIIQNELENLIRGGIRQTSSGTFINLPPPDVEMIINKVANNINEAFVDPKDIVLVVSADIRRFVKKLIENHYSDLDVLSFSDLSPSVEIDIIGSINN